MISVLVARAGALGCCACSSSAAVGASHRPPAATFVSLLVIGSQALLYGSLGVC